MESSWLDAVPSVLDEIKTLGREGRPQGATVVAGSQDQGRGRQGHLWVDSQKPLAAGVLLRPQAPMGLLTGLAPVCGYACAQVLKADGLSCALAWPNDLVVEGTGASGAKLGSVICEAGYGDGVFVAAVVQLNVAGAPASVEGCGSPEPREACAWDDFLAPLDAEEAHRLGQDLAAAMTQECQRWESAIAQGAGAAGPLGPILSQWFDEMPLMGTPVRALWPDGRVAAQGLMAGIDGWGRITVIDEEAVAHELSFEQVSLRPGSSRDAREVGVLGMRDPL